MTTTQTKALSSGQLDRAAGVLLATACGDALGAGYEFGPAMAPGTPVAMIGGGLGGFAPGEWTDDTSMAVAVAEAAAAGLDLRFAEGLDAVAAGFARWYAEGPKDVGVLTSAVLSRAGARSGTPAAADLVAAAAEEYERIGRAAGNGGLMRTAAVALGHLADAGAAADAARAVSDLTHAEQTSAEACVIWTLAIRHAVLHGTFDGVRGALAQLPADRSAYWAERLDEAEARDPRTFSKNGWVVGALQAAWSAITRTPVPEDDPGRGSFAADHLRLALEAAVRVGHDTDTVAAIAGGLLGARWGASAVPLQWRREVHGWPGYRARDLVRIGVQAAARSVSGGAGDEDGWPVGARVSYSQWDRTDAAGVHPLDPQVLLGGVERLYALPEGVDAVVSLCRLGAEEAPAPGVEPRDHVEVWFKDAGRHGNPHLEYVIDQAARAVAALRAEGRTVLLHCVAGASRTPTVAARYSTVAFGADPETAMDEVLAALPHAHPKWELQEARMALGGRAADLAG